MGTLERYAEVEVTAQYPNSLRIQLAIVYLLLGELDKAAEVVDELYERCERAGESWLLSYALWGRGFLSLTRGDLEQAEAHLREALTIKRFFHDTLSRSWASIPEPRSRAGSHINEPIEARSSLIALASLVFIRTERWTEATDRSASARS